MHLRAALFDLDGTLLDSLHDIGAAMNHALATQGLPLHPLAGYRRFVGEGVRVLVSRAVPADRADCHEAVLAAYKAFYAEHLLDHTRPYPGVREVLARLQEEGVKLAVLSNKPDAATRGFVEALLPEVRLGAVYGERARGLRLHRRHGGGHGHRARRRHVQRGCHLGLPGGGRAPGAWGPGARPDVGRAASGPLERATRRYTTLTRRGKPLDLSACSFSSARPCAVAAAMKWHTQPSNPPVPSQKPGVTMSQKRPRRMSPL